MSYALAQTFYFDGSAVGSSPTAFLTSVSLYFKALPSGGGIVVNNDWYNTTNAAWGSFLNTYGIWRGGRNDVTTNSIEYPVPVNFPVTGNYSIIMSADNSGSVLIDGIVAASYAGFTNSTTVIKSISAGNHTIGLSVTNVPNSITSNPAAIGVRILAPNGSEVWNSRKITSRDPVSVGNSGAGTNNVSGQADPVITIAIADCKADNSPNLNSVHPNSIVQKKSSEVTNSTDASIETAFQFSQPVPLITNRRYAIVIQMDDTAFHLWEAKVGFTLTGTSTPFGGFSGSNQGALFDFGNDGTPNARAGTQLKYKVGAAKFTSNTAVVEIVDKKYEFLNITGQSAEFLGGEKVIQLAANAAGTVTLVAGSNTITGSGTSFNTLFTTNNYFAAYSNSTHVIARKVVAIASATSMTVDEAIPLAYSNSTGANYFKTVGGLVYDTLPANNKLYLVDSSSNSTAYFAAGNSVIGTITQATASIDSVNAVPITTIDPEIGITVPAGGNASIAFNLAYNDAGVYKVNPNNLQVVDNHKSTKIESYNPLLLSRSMETNATHSSYMYGSTNKSGLVKITLTQEGDPAAGLYTSPYVFTEQLDIFSGSNLINNDSSNEEKVYGSAVAKHITTKLTFEAGNAAQDLRVYALAYKPAGTEVLAYAKVYNSKDPETYISKDWTPLTPINNTDNTMSSIGSDTYYEYTWGIPSAPISAATLAGTVTTTQSSAIITGSGTTFNTDLDVNDLVKVYSPLFPDQYQVSVVNSISSDTSLTLNEAISNTSLVGSGFSIDRISNTTHTAFVNPQNGNVTRYYNLAATGFDTFDTVQVKMVMLSNNVNIIPRINNLRVIGVSA